MSDIARKMLKRWVQARGYRRAASALNVSVAALQGWTAGEYVPELKHREVLQDRVGIPREQWDLADGVVGAKPAAEVVTLVSAQPPGLPPNATARERALRHVQDLDRMVAEATAQKLHVTQLAKLHYAYDRSLVTLARCSGELLTESAILRSPQWQRLWSKLEGVLDRHPDVAEEMAAALETEGAQG